MRIPLQGLDLGPDIDACSGDTLLLTANVAGATYIWQDGSTLSQYEVTDPGTYTLMVTNACGSDSDTVMITMLDPPLPIDLGADTVLCEGEVWTWSLNPGPDAEVLWSDGSANTVFTTSQEGLVFVTVTNGCGASNDSVLVGYLSLPDPFTLGSDTTLCPGEVLVLESPLTSDLVWWSDGSNDSTLLVDQPGTYTLTIENECGEVTDDIQVNYDQQEPVLSLPDSIDLCRQNNTTLNATQSTEATYLWNTGSTMPIIVVNEPGIYSVTVQTACYRIDQSVEAFLNPGCNGGDFYIPNAFTPDGDGTNDVFSFYHHSNITVTSVAGSIFDRWGNLIYQSDDMPFVWDGTFRGQPMMPGTYVYMIQVRYRQLERDYETVWSGDINLIR